MFPLDRVIPFLVTIGPSRQIQVIHLVPEPHWVLVMAIYQILNMVMIGNHGYRGLCNFLLHGQIQEPINLLYMLEMIVELIQW